MSQAGFIEGGGGADDDESDDGHAGDAAHQHVPSGMLVLAGPHALFDEPGLQIEELPGRDGGAHQGDQQKQIIRAMKWRVAPFERAASSQSGRAKKADKI